LFTRYRISKKKLLGKGVVQEPILNLSKIPANRGDIVNLNDIISKDNKTEFVFYIYWKNGKTRVDLDLSVYGVDDNYLMSDKNFICDFTQLCGFNSTANHSGDITDAPNGASEFIRFNMDELKKKIQNLNMLS